MDLLIALPIINLTIMFLVLQFLQATMDDIVKHIIKLFAFYIIVLIIEVLLYLIIEYITDKLKK
jgi:hypothetical protein